MPIINRLEQVMLEYAARHSKRLTLRDVAQSTGLAESTISRVISGKHSRLDYSTLEKLCGFFECQPGDLLIYIPDGHTPDAGQPADDSEAATQTA